MELFGSYRVEFRETICVGVFTKIYWHSPPFVDMGLNIVGSYEQACTLYLINSVRRHKLSGEEKRWMLEDCSDCKLIGN